MKYKRRHDTIIIHGSHPHRRKDFDWNRTDCDVWVFNEAVKTETNTGFAPADKIAAIIQLHKPVIWKNPNNRNDPNHYQFLKETNIPVFMIDEYPEIKTSIKYPLDEIISTFKTEYFTSSVAEAIALAIYLGYTKIEIVGVEMETNTEYAEQRPGVTFWAGYARGLGLEVIEHWSIYNHPIYGFGGEVTLSYADIIENIEKVKADCDMLKQRYEEQFEKTQKSLALAVNTGIRKDGQQFSEDIIELLKIGEEFGKIDGQRQENERYKKKADAMKEAAGEFIFSRQEFEGAHVAHAKGIQQMMAEGQVAGGKFEALFNTMMQTTSKKNRLKRMAKLAPTMDEYVQKRIKAAMHAGGMHTNKIYLGTLDKLIHAAGGSKSEEAMLEAMK